MTGLLAAFVLSGLAGAAVECNGFHAQNVARECGAPVSPLGTPGRLGLDLGPSLVPSFGAAPRPGAVGMCTGAHYQLVQACQNEAKALQLELEDADEKTFKAVEARIRVFIERYTGVAITAAKIPTPRGGTWMGDWDAFETVTKAWDTRIGERRTDLWKGKPVEVGTKEVAADAMRLGRGAVEAVREASGGGGGLSLVAVAETEMEKAGLTDPASKAWLAREYQLSGSTTAAGRVLDAALRADPTHAESRGLRAVNRLAAGDAEGARADAKAALARDPAHELGRQVLAYLASAGSSGRIRAPKSLKGFEPQPDPGVGSGAVAAAAGGVGPAAPGAVAGTPARARTLALLTEARRKAALGDLTGAALDATRAIALDPSEPAAWTVRAHASNRAGKWAAAQSDAEEALKLSPADVGARLERAYALLQQGRVAEALADTDAVLKDHPGNALAHLYRAMALEKAGRGDEAAAAYRQALAFDPGLAVIVDEALARLGAAGTPARPARSSPLKPVLWVVLAVTAAGLLMEGLKRVFKPGWSTTAPAGPGERESSTLGTLPSGHLLAGNYRIAGELARGGMGVVYRGTDLLLKRPVAVKQLKAELYREPAARERFLREAQLAAKLRHPGIAQVFSVVDEGELFLVFELVEGEGLDALLARRKRLPPGEVARLLEPVCAAVDYAHSERVIHRDLKPSNVMTLAGGACKVLDFGIAHEARTASRETRTEPWGTPPYMAPEQESGSVSARSDLFALAVMTYELAAGERPFPGQGALMLKLAGRFQAPSAAGLPSALDSVFARALAPDPAARFESAAAFLAAFRSGAGTASGGDLAIALSGP